MLPQLAHYIDPGTGSMLFTLFIGIVTTAYFFARQLIIKLKFAAKGGHAEGLKGQEKLPYVIFGESKRYWNVFKPVCDEFERRGIDVAYWTASPDDPALEERYEHVACEFIGEENKAFARLNMMSASVCLATTPGLDVYQWKRSPEVDWYAHMLHAVGSAAGYRMFGIDYYDALLLSGAFQVDEVRELERKRSLPPKECEIVGCTYLDVMARRRGQEGSASSPNTTVLLAPSWGPSAILSVYGGRIIQALVDTGFDVVIRPHPQSMASERELLDGLMAEFPEGDHLSWNFDNDNFDVLNRCDVMISDFSGVVFDYALVFDKPVIYTEGRFDTDPYDAAWLDKPLWKFSVYPTLGVSLTEEELPQLKEVIERAMADEALREGRAKARREVWAHPGEAARLTVDYLVRTHEMLERGERPEVEVPAQGKHASPADAADAPEADIPDEPPAPVAEPADIGAASPEAAFAPAAAEVELRLEERQAAEPPEGTAEPTHLASALAKGDPASTGELYAMALKELAPTQHAARHSRPRVSDDGYIIIESARHEAAHAEDASPADISATDLEELIRELGTLRADNAQLRKEVEELSKREAEHTRRYSPRH